jgi:hypothetical protein
MKINVQTRGWIIAGWVSRLIVAAVFIIAAAPKILHPHEFAIAVFRYQLAPYWSVNLAAVFFPWIELVTGVALLCAPRLRDAAAVIIFGMLAVFTTAIGIALYRGIDISCGCFSVNPHAGAIGILNILRNLVLMALTVVAFVTARRMPRSDHSPGAA